MNERRTIKDLLNNFSSKRKNISWKMKCLYCDGKGITMNQIIFISQPECNSIGTFVYQVETGIVTVCKFKTLQKSSSQNIIDMLLDMINHFKKERLV